MARIRIGMGVLKNPILIAVARFIERFLYRHADAIVVNSPAYRDYLIEHGIAAQKIYFVPNGVDAKAFSQADAEAALELRDQLGISEKFVVTYAGALGLANDLGTVLDTAMKLTDRDDIHFLIVGDGKEAANLKERAKSQCLTNVTFTGSLPKSKMPAVLAASDACLAILQNIPMFQMTYPNKVFDYMAAGKPTLLAIDGVIREVMEQADGGIFVPPQNPDALAKATVRLANSPELCKRMGKTASAYVRNHFNRDQQAIEFKRVVESLDRRKTANSIPEGPISEEQRNAA